MPMQWRLAVMLMAGPIVGGMTPVAAAQSSPQGGVAPATVVLIERWPDGRTIYELTTNRRAAMWTPQFPRIDGAPQITIEPVFAVQFVRTLEGRNIKVDISVLLGGGRQPGVPVASVTVSPGAEIVVNELAAFGIQPLTLSMATVAPLTPFAPTVVSASAAIEVSSVVVRNAPYPGYVVTLRNLGTKGVSNVFVQSYRRNERGLSSLQRTSDGRRLMSPGESYTFAINLTSGPADQVVPADTWTPPPLDVIEIQSVRWDDGSYDGTPPYPDADRAIETDSGRRLQLQRVVAALGPIVTGADDGRARLEAAAIAVDKVPAADPDQLAAAQAGMREIKSAAGNDLMWLAGDPAMVADPIELERRLTSLLARYKAWLVRLSPP